jgi:hypothetical protein
MKEMDAFTLTGLMAALLPYVIGFFYVRREIRRINKHLKFMGK